MVKKNVPDLFSFEFVTCSKRELVSLSTLGGNLTGVNNCGGVFSQIHIVDLIWSTCRL